MPQTNAEEIFGQAFVAFGQGTGAVRVHRETITAIRTRYERYIEAAMRDWEADAPQALERVRTTGRLAAHLATQDGRTAITARDFTQAAEKVERADVDELGRMTRICARGEQV